MEAKFLNKKIWLEENQLLAGTASFSEPLTALTSQFLFSNF
jgi:hypothetical protein